MLTVAKLACEIFLPRTNMSFDIDRGHFARESNDETETRTLAQRGLITKNGVAELWESLCHFENPGFVRRLFVRTTPPEGLYVDASTSGSSTDPAQRFFTNLYRRDAFPANSAIGDHQGRARAALTDDNLAPWCIYPPQDGEQQAFLDALATQLGKTLPLCPSTLGETGRVSAAEGSRWAMRGAANAGLAVFAYLDALAKGEISPQPAYDRCEDL
jgi:hypothetical protein